MTHQSIYTVDPKKGQVVVGYFDSVRKTLVLPKDRVKHYMRIVEGYGMQIDIYMRAMKRECFVEIRESGELAGSQSIYRSHITDWQTHGKSAEYGGHGTQRFLSLKYMKKIV